MNKKRLDKVLFIWDKIKSVPSTGNYWVMIGLALGSEALRRSGNWALMLILLCIFIFELFKLFHYELGNQDKMELKDIRRAETIYNLLERDDDDSD